MCVEKTAFEGFSMCFISIDALHLEPLLASNICLALLSWVVELHILNQSFCLDWARACEAPWYDNFPHFCSCNKTKTNVLPNIATLIRKRLIVLMQHNEGISKRTSNEWLKLFPCLQSTVACLSTMLLHDLLLIYSFLLMKTGSYFMIGHTVIKIFHYVRLR
jgi:hypothetical protein